MVEAGVAVTDPNPRPHRTHPVTGVVLAGGSSRRLGRDKLRERIGGRPVLERVVDVLGEVVDDVVVVGPRAPSGTRRTVEASPGTGPLAALAAGLAAGAHPSAVVVAGDHAALRPELVELLVDRGSAADVVVPVVDGRRQLLCARYACALAPAARAAVDEGERSVGRFVDRLEVEELGEGDWRQADPDGRSFVDLDTPADLVRLRGLLSGEGR